MFYAELSHVFIRVARYCIVITTALQGKCAYHPYVIQEGTETEILWFTQGHKGKK